MNDARMGWRGASSLRKRVAAALAGPAAVTLLAVPENHPDTTVVAVLYVLTVVVAARVGGALAGLGASVASSLALNFFFTPPLHTFAIAAAEDLVALFVFLATSTVVGALLSSAVEAKAKAEQRELESRLLNGLATRLLAGEAVEKVMASFAQGICDLLDLDACEIVTSFTSPARAGSVPDSQPERFPLRARGQDVGEMRVWLGDQATLTGDEHSVLTSLVAQLALALDGMRLSVDVRRAELDAQTSQLKAALFSGVTHDVKTPLAAITASVTSLLDGRDFSDDDLRAHLESIRQEADRLHRVVNNLLDIARLRAGALVAAKSLSPIDELMESVLNRLRPLLGDRPAEIRVGDDIPEIPMDVVQMDQVLTNLIENAIKFSPAGTPISLAAVGGAGTVRITVSDSGPGIPKEDRVRIFEPFERGSTRSAGTGLGLTICAAIVAAHDGRMWAAESPGGGAAFTLELPCATSSSEEVPDARASARR
ncbi:MAG TPA: ATP-binding protein [Actinomycetota bacterium]|nr:ATP-binding protein [Actinomycetota bacterium]